MCKSGWVLDSIHHTLLHATLWSLPTRTLRGTSVWFHFVRAQKVWGPLTWGIPTLGLGRAARPHGGGAAGAERTAGCDSAARVAAGRADVARALSRHVAGAACRCLVADAVARRGGATCHGPRATGACGLAIVMVANHVCHLPASDGACSQSFNSQHIPARCVLTDTLPVPSRY